MAFVTKNYDPAGVLISFAGAPVDGFAAGTFVVAERDEDSFTKVVGADGEAARAKSNNRGGTITFTLMQSSASNDFLSGRALLDELSGAGAGKLLIKDINGTTLVQAETAWVQKPANVEFGQELAEREWALGTGFLQIFPGGANLLVGT